MDETTLLRKAFLRLKSTGGRKPDLFGVNHVLPASIIKASNRISRFFIADTHSLDYLPL
jgi:hypothetical protein